MTLLNAPLVIASDHAGYALKSAILASMRERGYAVIDLGANSDMSVDYPDFGQAAARAILDGKAQWGIVICGTGIGISIAANRFKGIRCALCGDVETAKLARRHNNANMLALAGRLLQPDQAEAVVAAFAETAFEGGRHEQRLIKIDQGL